MVARPETKPHDLNLLASQERYTNTDARRHTWARLEGCLTDFFQPTSKEAEKPKNEPPK
jgi:hypothetical protein